MKYEIISGRDMQIIAATGYQAKNLKALFNKLSGKDRALMAAGIALYKRENLYVSDSEQLSNPDKAAAYLRQFFENELAEEQIFAVLLNNRNCPIDVVEVSKTSCPAGAELDTRKLMKAVINTGCSAVILGHNHPSGDTDASDTDRKFTKKIEEILSAVEVDLLDHLVITKTGYSRVSMY